MNRRGTVSAVQKAGRNSKKGRKRKAVEMEASESGNIESGAPLAPPPGVPPSRTPGEPTVRNTRAATARGVLICNH
jgi:hypothetical protein